MVLANGDEHPTFLTDRQTMWDKISDLTRDHECWTYVKPAQRSHDGRQGYTLLFDHYLGTEQHSESGESCRSEVEELFVPRQTPSLELERFVCMQVEQHEILNGLTKYGYSGIDDGSKVRYLLGGIRLRIWTL